MGGKTKKKPAKKTKMKPKTKQFLQIFLAFVISLGVGLGIGFIVKATDPPIEPVEKYDYTYLSDFTAKSSSAGDNNKFYLDRNYSGGRIMVSVDGQDKSFYKGVFAHAPSTVVYDLRGIHYYYFTAYIGVDSDKRENMQGDGVTFKIYISQDEENWTEILNDNTKFSKKTDSKYVKLKIKGAKYLKLVAESGNNNWSDHAVYADAKLTKEDYVEKDPQVFKFVKTVEEYDAIIKKNYNKPIKGEYEKAIYQREFVSHFDYEYLQFMMNYRKPYKDTLYWLMNDINNLKLYILGGAPEGGSYTNSLKVLTELYSAYKNDFQIKTPTKYAATAETKTKGELYKKMAISLSLTHSQWVGLWMQNIPENTSNAVTRYKIYKDMYNKGKMKKTDNLDITKWFENYTVEEMRFLFNVKIDDEEIEWLNDFCQKRIDADPNNVYRYLTSHWIMAYVYPNYNRAEFHDPSRKDYWDEKWDNIFSKYGVSYSREGYKILKLWMNFRNEFGTGAVCGGISKTGMCIRGSNGMASTCIGQPGHCAMLHYNQDSDGNGYWLLDNDVSGWTRSEKGERLLLSWGNTGSYYVPRGTFNVPYMMLSQEALNDYAAFAKSEELCLLAKSYAGDLTKQEELYRKATEAQKINLDAWLGLINTFLADGTKTEAQLYKLAEDVAGALKYFPLPMKNLTDLIKPRLTSLEYSEKFLALQEKTLKEASQTPNNTNNQYYVYQPSITRVEANYLLQGVNATMATFSFDGADAGKIVLDSRFNNIDINWEYCLNGSIDSEYTWKKVTFTSSQEHKLQLTASEIASINDESDIWIRLSAATGEETNQNEIYVINILPAESLPTNLYANDLENKLIGVAAGMQWRYQTNSTWTYFETAQPDLTGNKAIIVRMGATGVHMAGTEVQLFTFTADNQTNTAKYVSIDHLSIAGFSSTTNGRGEPAENAIDGNANTIWHTNRTTTTQHDPRWIIVKLDSAKYISKVQLVKKANYEFGAMKNGKISVSMDGENWEEVVNITDLYTAQNKAEILASENSKDINFATSTKALYIKIECTESCEFHQRTGASVDYFFSLAMINLFEDTTKTI